MRFGRPPTIADAMARPANGFAAVRLALALAVVVSHAFSVTTGRVEAEPLHAWTGYTLGEHAVNGFFAISGFLVTMSFVRRGPRDYAAARALRIVPGLVAAVLVVALAIGPAMTTSCLRDYLTDPELRVFLVRTLTTLKSTAPLPGLFRDNPLHFSMGTVWTLKYEVLCYVAVLLAGAVGLLRGRAPSLVVAAGLFGALLATNLLLPNASLGTTTTLRLAFIFAAGAAFHQWRDAVRLSWLAAAALAGLAALAARTPAYPALLYGATAYGVLVISLSQPLARPVFDLRQDLSYGVYLYGWPIQQVLRALDPGAGSPVLLAVSLPLSLGVAALSWRLVERPALRLKARALGLRTLRTIEPAAP